MHECSSPGVTMSAEEAHQLLHALEHAASHLGAVDVSNAEANLAEVRHRPLTGTVKEAAGLMDRLLHGAPEKVVSGTG